LFDSFKQLPYLTYDLRAKMSNPNYPFSIHDNKILEPDWVQALKYWRVGPIIRTDLYLKLK